jgi:hypothetical protein
MFCIYIVEKYKKQTTFKIKNVHVGSIKFYVINDLIEFSPRNH